MFDSIRLDLRHSSMVILDDGVCVRWPGQENRNTGEVWNDPGNRQSQNSWLEILHRAVLVILPLRTIVGGYDGI